MTAPPIESCSAGVSRIGGRDVVTFGGCNYLGLAQHPDVVRAAAEAMGRYGLSASASRETTGNRDVHDRLERALATFCGLPGGVVLPDGYTANLAALQGLAALGVREAVADERAHASLTDAARLAGMSVRTYAHGDAVDARRALRSCVGSASVLTDSVFAADGAVAPAAALLDAIGDDHWLVLDDCHGLAVVGDRGRGTAAWRGLVSDRLVVTSTLAKGLGCGGGVVFGDARFIGAVRAGSTAYVCTTPASPALAAAALEAVGVLERDTSLVGRLRDNVRLMHDALGTADDRARADGIPIFAFVRGDAGEMRALHDAAWEAGVWLPLVAYPGGPGSLYFRLSVTAAHTGEQIARVGSLLRACREGAR